MTGNGEPPFEGLDYLTKSPTEEPSADSRQFARAMRDLFVALQAEGFSERQAILLLGQAIAAAQGTSE